MQIWLKPPYQPEFQTTLEDVKAKVSSGLLNPTDSYFWKEGMTEWEPVTNLVGNSPASMPPPPRQVEIQAGVTPKSSSNATNSPVSKEELEELFVHKNYKYYKRQFISPSFNWAAFFFPLQWSAYRKMDSAAYIYIGISMLYVVCNKLFSPSVGIAIPIIFWLIPAMAYGFLGNVFYKKKCDKCLNDNTLEENDSDQIKYSVTNAGGVSFLKVIGFTLFLAFMMVIMGGTNNALTTTAKEAETSVPLPSENASPSKQTVKAKIVSSAPLFKVKGLYIGMDIKNAYNILSNTLSGEYGVEILDKPQNDQILKADKSYVLIGLMGALGSVVADRNSRVECITLSRSIVDKLFDSSNMDIMEFIEQFQKSYNIDFEISADLKSMYYTSPDGTKITISDDKSIEMIKVPSKSQVESNFSSE